MNRRIIIGVVAVFVVTVAAYLATILFLPASWPSKDTGGVTPLVTPDASPIPAPVLGTWVWENTVGTDGTTVTPRDGAAFSLIFTDDGHVSGTTDCNSFTGSYRQSGPGEISFSQFASTKKYCADAQESVFTDAVLTADRYSVTFTILTLTLDGGEMHFTKQ